MNWYLEALRKYATFSGRARRKEYWLFTLFNILISLALGAIEGFLDLFPNTEQSVLAMIYGLAVFLPGLAVTVRRLHDTGRSGWWMWIALVPLIGVIVLLVFLAKDSEPGKNRYGPNPKAVPSAAFAEL